MKPKPKIPLWRWAMWWAILAFSLVVFYVLATPIWLALRGIGMVSRFQARRRQRA